MDVVPQSHVSHGMLISGAASRLIESGWGALPVTSQKKYGCERSSRTELSDGDRTSFRGVAGRCSRRRRRAGTSTYRAARWFTGIMPLLVRSVGTCRDRDRVTATDPVDGLVRGRPDGRQSEYAEVAVHDALRVLGEHARERVTLRGDGVRERRQRRLALPPVRKDVLDESRCRTCSRAAGRTPSACSPVPSSGRDRTCGRAVAAARVRRDRRGSRARCRAVPRSVSDGAAGVIDALEGCPLCRAVDEPVVAIAGRGAATSGARRTRTARSRRPSAPLGRARGR